MRFLAAIFLVILVVVLPRLGLVGPEDSMDPAKGIPAWAASPTTFFYLDLEYILMAIALLLTVLALRERMQASAPMLTQVALITTSIGCAFWLAAGLVSHTSRFPILSAEDEEGQWGNGNSVLTWRGFFDKELSWQSNLESIFWGHCTMSSQEVTEDKGSFWTRRTSISFLLSCEWQKQILFPSLCLGLAMGETIMKVEDRLHRDRSFAKSLRRMSGKLIEGRRRYRVSVA